MLRRVRQLMFVCVLLGMLPPARAQDYDYGGGGNDDGGGGDDYVPTRWGGVLRNQIDLELLNLVASSVALRYERSLNRHVSLAVRPEWWWGFDDGENFDFGVTLQLRWYPQGHAMNGWYLSPQAGFFQIGGDDYNGNHFVDRSYLYALVFGYDWIIAHALSLYLGGGVAYTHGPDDLGNSHYPLYVLGPFPVFEFGIGVPF